VIDRTAATRFFSATAAAPANGQPAPISHRLEDWINIRALQLLAHHTSAVIATVVLFWLVGFIVQHLLHEGMLKRCVLIVDEFVLLCLFVYFAYELFIFL
jgi:hypothetical protein